MTEQIPELKTLKEICLPYQIYDKYAKDEIRKEAIRDVKCMDEHLKALRGKTVWHINLWDGSWAGEEGILCMRAYIMWKNNLTEEDLQ